MDVSPHGNVVAWRSRRMEVSPHGNVAAWKCRRMEVSPHGLLFSIIFVCRNLLGNEMQGSHFEQNYFFASIICLASRYHAIFCHFEAAFDPFGDDLTA